MAQSPPRGLVGVRRASRLGRRAGALSATAFLGAVTGARRCRSARCRARVDRSTPRQAERSHAGVVSRRASDRRRAAPHHRIRRLAGVVATDGHCSSGWCGDAVRARLRAQPRMNSVATIAPERIEGVARDLYLRALKELPPDIKRGFAALAARETGATAKAVLGTMIENIAVAERDGNLLCQDTGIPIYNVTIGRGVDVDGVALKAAIRKGCERATREHPLRSSIVHPLTRKNEHTSCGIGVPVIHVDVADDFEGLRIEMIPKGSGSENNSWLKMAIPADGTEAVKTFVVDCVLDAGGRTCPPTIIGVGVGGTADLCVHLAKRAAIRPLGTHCADPEGAQLEEDLSAAVNLLGVGPQGLGGDSTAFAVHVELAATHITMNPVAVNMQCHSARRASVTMTTDGVRYAF